jgi:hypothetical protein
VKPEHEKDFLEAERSVGRPPGMRRGTLVKTGNRTYCFIGEWESKDALVAARPAMIAQLTALRHMLEDLGGGLGVTDPVSGEAVLDMR